MKRGIVNRFDGITGKETAKRTKNRNKNQSSGRWRSIKQIRIKYIYILQTLYYEEKTYTQKFICPLGMVKYRKNVLKDQKLFHGFSVFPNAVKEAFSFTTSADYDHDKLKRQCEDEGDKGYDDFYVLFCSICSKDQSQKGTIAESAFDLSRNFDKATRISYIKELHLIYYKYLHELKEDFKDFHVSIKYPSKIKCSESELISEFSSI